VNFGDRDFLRTYEGSQDSSGNPVQAALPSLALLEEVRQTRQSLLVTRHGKPMAEISPYVPRDRDSVNPLKGSILYQDDLVAPIEEKWDSTL
jgi:antitoxin (DNA-binding transcriptional repressor) of toxin-antitoxin stability system